MLVLPFSVETLGLSQAAVDEVNLLLGRGDTLFRFLLEGVQDVDRFLKSHRVNSAPCVAVMVRENLDHRSSAKMLQRLRRRIGVTLLGGIERLANIASDLARETAQVSSARADPDQRASAAII
jgi:E3 ubiquitin-protein ligase DOA10